MTALCAFCTVFHNKWAFLSSYLAFCVAAMYNSANNNARRMPVRNSAKALVLRGGKLLVNRCTSRFGEYYALPGGGQREGETLLEAVRRELLEETGYRVLPMRLSAIYERVCAQREGGMSHKLYFVFLCRLEDEKERVPTERDRYQVGMEWVEVEALRNGDLFPRAIRDNLPALLGAGETIYLGSERER